MGFFSFGVTLFDQIKIYRYFSRNTVPNQINIYTYLGHIWVKIDMLYNELVLHLFYTSNMFCTWLISTKNDLENFQCSCMITYMFRKRTLKVVCHTKFYIQIINVSHLKHDITIVNMILAKKHPKIHIRSIRANIMFRTVIQCFNTVLCTESV